MNAAADIRARDHRLRWHCRRALLELDIVFSRYWAQIGEASLPENEAAALTRLLALEDHDLWRLLTQTAETTETADIEVNSLLQRLRAL